MLAEQWSQLYHYVWKLVIIWSADSQRPCLHVELGTHYPCPRALFTAREHGCHILTPVVMGGVHPVTGRAWTRPVHTGCVYRTLVTTVIIPHLCFPAYYHSFDPQKNFGYAPMRWCMACYCHNMLSVTLVYCKYRKRHAWNICMRLNSPTSWVSVCLPTCIRIFRRRPADFPHGSSYYYNGSSKCGRRSLTSYRSRCNCLKFS